MNYLGLSFFSCEVGQLDTIISWDPEEIPFMSYCPIHHPPGPPAWSQGTSVDGLPAVGTRVCQVVGYRHGMWAGTQNAGLNEAHRHMQGGQNGDYMIPQTGVKPVLTAVSEGCAASSSLPLCLRYRQSPAGRPEPGLLVMPTADPLRDLVHMLPIPGLGALWTVVGRRHATLLRISPASPCL